MKIILKQQKCMICGRYTSDKRHKLTKKSYKIAEVESKTGNPSDNKNVVYLDWV